MKSRRKCGRILLAFMIGSILAFLSTNAAKVSAAETELKENMMLKLLQDTMLMEEPSETSNPVGELPEGTTVISLEAASDGWIKVRYQDLTGYIPLENSGMQDSKELDEEFEQIANEYRLIFEVIEYKNTQNRQNLIWGIVIVALVIAIFAVGIASVALNSHKTAGKNHKTHHGK